MYYWFAIALVLAFSGLVEAMLGFEIPLLALRSMILFLLVLGMTYTYYRQEQASSLRQFETPEPAEALEK